MDDNLKLLDSLISISTEMYRFRGVFQRVLEKLDQKDRGKYMSQYSWFEKRVLSALTVLNLRIVDDLQGKSYDPGMAVTPLNVEDFEPEDELFIQQVVEPIIMQGDTIMKTGTVILGGVK